MSNVATEFEHEMEFELEHELEHESEHEQEAEHEAFFNHLAAMADRAGRSQSLRRIALAAGRSALRANRYSYPVIEGETEAAAEAELGQASTASSRRRCLDRYERALARYSDLMLRRPLSALPAEGSR